MYQTDVQKRMLAAYNLLTDSSFTHAKLDEIRTLIKDINPRLDTTLEKVSHAFSEYEKISQGEIIELTAEHLPEQTEEEKKRKKKFLFLFQSLKDLQGEIKRVQNELENNSSYRSPQEQVRRFGRLITGAKGAFGVVTIIAVAIVGFMIITNIHQTKPAEKQVAGAATGKTSIKGIIVNGKKIPLGALYIGYGPDCDSPHYHAINEKAQALDGSIVQDPGGCGFGRVKDVAVVDIQ